MPILSAELCSAPVLAVLVLTAFLPFLLLPFPLSLSPRGRKKHFGGKHVLIAGGSSGIGKDTAKQLAACGARVTIVARDKVRLMRSVEEIQKLQLGDANVVGLSYDLSGAEASESMVAEAERRQGPVDILMNIAGGSVAGYFEETSPAVFERMMHDNYFAALYPTLAVFKRMKTRRRGHIVLTSSVAGLFGVFGFGAYCPAKFAIRGLADVLFYEGKPFGIGITILYPPDTNTPGFQTEQIGKPPETTEISNSAGLWNPDVVATRLLDGVVANRFTVVMGFESAAVAMMTAGMSPGTSLLEIIALPFLRVASQFYVWHFSRIVARGHRKRFPESFSK